MTKRRVVLVCGGEWSGADLLRRYLAQSDKVISVDGGARWFWENGFVPHFALGDFDSVQQSELAARFPATTQIIPTPDQEYTDLDKALGFCQNVLGAQQVLVWGALGGRLDHTFGALTQLVKHGAAMDVRLVDAVGETRFVSQTLRVTADDTLSQQPLIGRGCALLALGKADGICTTGVRWPLDDESLEPGVREDTSNETTAETITVSVRSGSVLLFLQHGPP